MKRIENSFFLFLASVIMIIGACYGTGSQGVSSATKLEAASFPARLKSASFSAVVLSMEGKTYTMEQTDLNPQTTLDFENDHLQFVIYTNDSPVSINLNLTKTGLVGAGSKSYSIPEANLPTTLVDLSFFDKNRESSRINKRVVFKKGEIEIEKLTRDELHLTFRGEGAGMTERGDLFPIEGSIHLNF